MKFIDLSAEISHGMVRHPAPHLPPVEITQVATHEKQKRSVQRISFGTHVSTHIDAPLHAIPGGDSIETIPLDTLCGVSALIHLKGVGKNNPIDVSHLTPFKALLDENIRVIFDTGWAKETWGKKSYFTEGPFLTHAAADYLSNFNIKMLGMDFPNIDSNEDTVPGVPAPNHNIILGKGTILLENLLNLHLIDAAIFKLTALPLRLVGGDGCPCRAIAEV